MAQTKFDKFKSIWNFFRFMYIDEVNPFKSKNHLLKYYKIAERILNCKTNEPAYVYHLYSLCCFPSVFVSFYFIFLFINKDNKSLDMLNIAKMFDFHGNIYLYFAIVASLGLFLHKKLYLNIDPYILNSQQVFHQKSISNVVCLFGDKYKQQTPRAYIYTFIYKLLLALQLFLSFNSKIY